MADRHDALGHDADTLDIGISLSIRKIRSINKRPDVNEYTLEWSGTVILKTSQKKLRRKS